MSKKEKKVMNIIENILANFDDLEKAMPQKSELTYILSTLHLGVGYFCYTLNICNKENKNVGS